MITYMYISHPRFVYQSPNRIQMPSSSVQTRSQSKNTRSDVVETHKYTYDLRSSIPKEPPVVLNFDESSRAWRSNKRSVGNGCYTYLVNEPEVKSEHPKRMRRSPVRYQV